MMQGMFTVRANREIARNTYWMRLDGRHGFDAPGQFLQISVAGFFLRRPFAVCEYDAAGFSLVYVVVGGGTDTMTRLRPGAQVDVLTGLGNHYDTSPTKKPVLIGGSAGAAPLLALAAVLRNEGKPVKVILGFVDADEVCLREEFEALGCETFISTDNPSVYYQGFPTDLLSQVGDYDYFYTCGAEPMMKAVYEQAGVPGQISFDSRMACGFGVCMGCSVETKNGSKRMCKEGPVLSSEEVLWRI